VACLFGSFERVNVLEFAVDAAQPGGTDERG
jgi:hypothetical protein